MPAKAIPQTERSSGRDPVGQLMLMANMVSVRPGTAQSRMEIEPALRDRGRSDPRARAVLQRLDRQRLRDLQDFQRAAGVAESELLPKAQLIYAAVIGLESPGLIAGIEVEPPLRDLVNRLVTR